MTSEEKEEYGADNIKVLKGLDAVRKRPGMYIGDTDDGSGLHHMVYEVVDNSIDEALAGYCTHITICLNRDGSVTVIDNGRGIPVDMHEEGVSAAEVIMTHLHSGGKFDKNTYKVSGGLHGVGVSVVNALSRWLHMTIWRNESTYEIKFSNGVPDSPLSCVGSSNGKRGTMITFMPSTDVFKFIDFNFSIIESRIRELAFLNSGIEIIIIDDRQRDRKESIFKNDGGIAKYLTYLDDGKNVLHEPICFLSHNQESGITVEVAIHWNDSYYENILCFTNNIRQRDGGTHLYGLKSGLTRVVSKYIDLYGKNNKAKVDGDDIREGLSCVLSVKVPDPKFASQTKEKLISSEVRQVVESSVIQHVEKWFEEHPSQCKTIVSKVIEAAIAREAARKAREFNRKKSSVTISNIVGKIADCQQKNPEQSELYLVEGDSAGGTAKQGRDRKYQAVLPLRGKVINPEKSRLDKVLGSDQIGTLITALSAGIAEDFDISKLRYHKIIIMTDADVDGSHIKTLLLTFFYRHMREIISNGYLYIAQPPLYKVKKGNTSTYLKNESAMEEYLIENITKDYSINSENSSKIIRSMIKFSTFIKDFHDESVHKFLEAMYMSGIKDRASEACDLIASILNQIPNHKKFNVSLNGDNLLIEGLKHEVLYKQSFDLSAMDSMEYFSEMLNLYRNNELVILHKDKEVRYPLISQIVDHMIKSAQSGISIQRFKGLGEMNAEQLWETTLDPNVRTLLKISINDCDEAEKTFSVLMGDEVAPRKMFIQENAKKVKNLDI